MSFPEPAPIQPSLAVLLLLYTLAVGSVRSGRRWALVRSLESWGDSTSKLGPSGRPPETIHESVMALSAGEFSDVSEGQCLNSTVTVDRVD